MTTKRDARQMGYDVGHGIASERENFVEWFNQFAERKGGNVFVQDKDEFIDQMAAEASTVESEHYRQFSPFEETAQEFNDSRDPDGVWEAYEDGVHKGAKDAAKAMMNEYALAVFVLKVP